MKQEDIFKQYIEKIQKAPEQKLLQDTKSLGWSFRICRGNYTELLKLLKALEDDEKSIKLWDVSRQGDLHAVFEEIGRLLFNFLASTSMLIDHTRRYVDKTCAGEKHNKFRIQYAKEIQKRFEQNPNHQIAKGLRNFVQHRNLPSVGSQLTFTPETGLNKEFMISTESLLEWDGWHLIAKKQLQSSDTFSLRKFIEDYFKQMESFHEWLSASLAELHKDDMERLNKMKKEAIAALKEAGLLTDDELRKLNGS